MPTRAFSIFLIVLSCWAGALNAGEIQKQSLAFAAPQYVLEDLMAESQAGGDVIYVAGRIRNRSHAPVRGYVVVYFCNSNNQPLHAMEAEVNRNEAFGHGQDGFFEVTANVAGLPNVVNVTVEFVDRPTPLQMPVKKLRSKQ